MKNKTDESFPFSTLHKSEEPIPLRSADGPLLGVLYLAPLRLEVKRNGRYFEVDLSATLATGTAVVLERAGDSNAQSIQIIA